MPLIDVEHLLQPVSDAEPAGPNLEYDPAFAALERAVLGKPEQQIGDAVVPGEPPEFGAVQQQASALLTRTKDLRVANHLVRALLHRHGFEGLRDGLALVRALLERYWALIHPQLDPDDNNDPIVRSNALSTISESTVLNVLRAAPLVRSRAFGVVSMRDIAIASGELKVVSDAPKLEMGVIEGAFQDCPEDVLVSTSEVLRGAADHVRGIEAVFSDAAGVSGPDSAALLQLLRQANMFVQQRLDRRRPAEPAPGAPPADGAGAPAPVSRRTIAPLAGEIGSRDDVVRALDKICAYYERHEPSSPLPLLLQRCKRLATMSFLDIVRDMVPDGLPQIETIAGKRGES